VGLRLAEEDIQRLLKFVDVQHDGQNPSDQTPERCNRGHGYSSIPGHAHRLPPPLAAFGAPEPYRSTDPVPSRDRAYLDSIEELKAAVEKQHKEFSAQGEIVKEVRKGITIEQFLRISVHVSIVAHPHFGVVSETVLNPNGTQSTRLVPFSAADSSNRRIGLAVNINGTVRAVCLRLLKPNWGLARRDLDRKAAAAASTAAVVRAYPAVSAAPTFHDDLAPACLPVAVIPAPAGRSDAVDAAAAPATWQDDEAMVVAAEPMSPRAGKRGIDSPPRSAPVKGRWEQSPHTHSRPTVARRPGRGQGEYEEEIIQAPTDIAMRAAHTMNDDRARQIVDVSGAETLSGSATSIPLPQMWLSS
jgi:hypothetical protein